MPDSDALAPALSTLAERFRRGDKTALARAISVVENERPGFQDLLHAVLDRGPRALRIGFTGPPGAGKSSLIAAAATTYRTEGDEVGVVAVDPTSPYSGGALLGDRIRMNDIATDPGIFIRSMATRGSLGGLATTTKEVVDLMDAFGFGRVLIETVGVGQTELEITSAADTVVVVLVPESGDAIQAMKAGLMEIADVFVVNKADRPGAARLVRDLRQALHLRAGHALRDIPAHHGVDLGRGTGREPAPESAPEPDGAWAVPVVPTNALGGEGLEDMLSAVAAHRSWLGSSGVLEERRRARAEGRVRDVVGRELLRRTWSARTSRELLAEGARRIAAGEETPYSVADRIVRALLR